MCIRDRVTAIATGSTEVKTTDLLKECDEAEAAELATQDFGPKVSNVKLAEKTDKFYVYQGDRDDKKPVRIVDKKGFIKVQSSNAIVEKCKVSDYKEVVEQLWKDGAVFKTDTVSRPDFFVCVGPRVGDYSAVDLEQIFLLMDLDPVSYTHLDVYKRQILRQPDHQCTELALGEAA